MDSKLQELYSANEYRLDTGRVTMGRQPSGGFEQHKTELQEAKAAFENATRGSSVTEPHLFQDPCKSGDLRAARLARLRNPQTRTEPARTSKLVSAVQWRAGEQTEQQRFPVRAGHDSPCITYYILNPAGK